VPPGRQLRAVAERVDRQTPPGQYGCGAGWHRWAKDRRWRRDTGRARDDWSARTPVSRSGDRGKHAVFLLRRDLADGTEPGCFEVESLRRPRHCFNSLRMKQLLAIEAAADRFEVWSDRQGANPGRLLQLSRICQPGHSTMVDASGVGSGSGHETLLQPAECNPPMPAGSACTVPHLPLFQPNRPRSPGAPQLQPCQRVRVVSGRPGAGAGGLPGFPGVRQGSRNRNS